MTRIAVGIFVGLLFVSSSWAQTFSGLPPATYSRPLALTDALLAGQPVPRAVDGTPDPNGRMVSVCIGMSNAVEYCKRQEKLLSDDPEYSAVTDTRFLFVRAAKPGHTAAEWSDPNEEQWALTVSAVEYFGATAAQVGHLHAYMTQAFPAERGGVMEASDIIAIVQNAKARFPNLSVMEFSSIQWTGTSTDGRAPVESVHGDDALLASMVGSIAGVVVEYTQVYADGDQPNAQTASPRFPAGLTWVAGDWVEDGVHPSADGAWKMGTSVIDRWRQDVAKPWMWVDRDSGPTTPPVVQSAGPFDAVVEREGLACRVVIGALSVIVPASLSVCDAAGLTP